MSFLNTKKSVESITSKLTSTITELEQHAEDQLFRAAEQKAVAAAAALAHEAYKAEHELAKRVAGNIKALLGA